jgi:hypothetical protein
VKAASDRQVEATVVVTGSVVVALFGTDGVQVVCRSIVGATLQSGSNVNP